MMFFIKICGGCLVISVIVGYFAILIGFGVICLEQANHSIDIAGLDQIGDAETLKTMAIILFVLAGLSLVVVLCTFHKIKVGIMIIKTTASFVQGSCQIILVPVCMFLAIVKLLRLFRLYSLCFGSLSLCLFSVRGRLVAVGDRPLLVLIGM